MGVLEPIGDGEVRPAALLTLRENTLFDHDRKSSQQGTIIKLGHQALGPI
jgi:hypothetical protein